VLHNENEKKRQAGSAWGDSWGAPLRSGCLGLGLLPLLLFTWHDMRFGCWVERLPILVAPLIVMTCVWYVRGFGSAASFGGVGPLDLVRQKRLHVDLGYYGYFRNITTELVAGMAANFGGAFLRRPVRRKHLYVDSGYRGHIVGRAS
jgi:hypothetical protein